MDTRKLIMTYQFSERLKSELIIASRLLATMDTIEPDQRAGAEKMMVSYLEALLGEIRIAKHIVKTMNTIGAEKKIMETIGKIKMKERSEIGRCISDAISLITTSCQRAMESLMEQRLI
jgi:hypothetical protein